MGSSSSKQPQAPPLPDKKGGTSGSGYPTQPSVQGASTSANPPPYSANPSQPVAPQPAFGEGGAPTYGQGGGFATMAMPQHQQGFQQQMQPYQSMPAPMPQQAGAPPVYHSTGVVMAGDQFSAGARPNNGRAPAIPPPPPGYTANTAQQASAAGHTVVVGQQQQTFLGGTGSSGAEFGTIF